MHHFFTSTRYEKRKTDRRSNNDCKRYRPDYRRSVIRCRISGLRGAVHRGIGSILCLLEVVAVQFNVRTSDWLIFECVKSCEEPLENSFFLSPLKDNVRSPSQYVEYYPSCL
jgi:hypothetical protein